MGLDLAPRIFYFSKFGQGPDTHAPVIRGSRSGIATTANHVHTHTGGGLGFGLRELFIFLFFRNLCREFVSVNTICERKFTGSTSTLLVGLDLAPRIFYFFYFSKFGQGPVSVIRKSRSACCECANILVVGAPYSWVWIWLREFFILFFFRICARTRVRDSQK